MRSTSETARSLGIDATFINSHVSPGERKRRLAAVGDGAYRLLYVAPERLAQPGFIQQLRRASWQTMVVDEAHCVSTWGHDFRPAYRYRQLRAACQRLNIEQICAFTATATPEVRADILGGLGLSGSRRPDVFVHGFARDNLTFHVEPIRHLRDKATAIASRLQRLRRGSAVIYATTHNNVERIATELGAHSITVGIYHAGLSETERSSVQRRFMSGDLPVIAATNAFGMGIDKPDIRLVVHHDVPGSLEAYYQEAGRAGPVTAGTSSPLNDGAMACVLMCADEASKRGIKPLAIFRHYVVVGVEPDIMGIGPKPAIEKLEKVSGIKRDEIGCYEINEAFAAQSVYCVRELGLDPNKVNPNGGAIALGHPLGATGGILTAKLVNEMKREKHRWGVVSMCIGGGMGAAGLFELA